MKMFKKKDGDKKMTATLTRVTKDSKTGKVTKSSPKKMEMKRISAKEFNSSSPKKSTPKPKPLSNEGKYGLGAVARTVKGQGEMKRNMAPPKKAKAVYTPTPAQKKKSAEAGHRAAEASRASGKKLNAVDKFIEREAQKFDNDIMEMPYYKGTSITKENRYKGMSNKQLGGSKPRMKTNFERKMGL
jgi:hypothetical protein